MIQTENFENYGLILSSEDVLDLTEGKMFSNLSSNRVQFFSVSNQFFCTLKVLIKFQAKALTSSVIQTKIPFGISSFLKASESSK
jgi:hypothetical protein